MRSRASKKPSYSDTRSLTDGDYSVQNTKSTEHMFGKLYVPLSKEAGADYLCMSRQGPPVSF